MTPCSGSSDHGVRSCIRARKRSLEVTAAPITFEAAQRRSPCVFFYAGFTVLSLICAAFFDVLLRFRFARHLALQRGFCDRVAQGNAFLSNVFAHSAASFDDLVVLPFALILLRDALSNALSRVFVRSGLP